MGIYNTIIKNTNNLKLCVENVSSSIEPIKLMRRYGLGYCLDIEHLQMELCGVFEEDFLRVMKLTSHVHLTGYRFGTMNWHTPIHHAPNHCSHILKLLKKQTIQE